MRTGLTISGAGHAAVLLWSVLTLVVRPYHAEPMKGLPVDLISAAEFSQMTNGAKNAPQTDHSKPVAEQLAEATPVDDPAAKLAKTEIKATTDVRVPPKPPEPKVEKPPQPPTDPIAEALKKDENRKPQPKKPDTAIPTPPKKPARREPAPQFDPRQVAALLDKRDSQRVASAAGNEINHALSLGVSGGTAGTPPLSGDPAGQLSQYELTAMRARLQEVWSPPPGAGKNLQQLTLVVEIQLNPDGTLSAPPQVLTSGNSPLFQATSDSAKRAVIRGQPYTMLKSEHYEVWKDFQITFDPQFMSGY